MGFDPAEVRLQGGVSAVEKLWPIYLEAGVNMCEIITKDKEILNWASTASYDLVFINGLFNDCGYGFAYKFNAPTIVYGTSSLFQWWGEVYVSLCEYFCLKFLNHVEKFHNHTFFF